MNDRNDYDGNHTLRPQPGTPTSAPYQITPEEMRVLNECNWESFTKRSLPLGTLLGVCAYAGVQRGIFKGNARFGAAPKVTLAVIFGYFLGKISYQRECAEKLMALPDSRIGQILREVKEKKGLTPPPMTMYGAKQEDIYSDAGPGSSLDLDTDRPNFTAGDDMTAANLIVPETSPKNQLSYDELRKRNREQYSDVRQDPYRIEPPNASGELSAPPPVIRGEVRPKRPQTNKYGDIVD